ncbi:MAG TPA: C40 family peptidase [Bacilli bacterium]
MKSFIHSRFVKMFAAISLGMTMLFSASIFIAPKTSHAAYASKASRIIATGKHFLGVRYKFGAPAGATYAFDCSSFVQYVYKKNGIRLPRLAGKQAHVGKFVKRRNLRPGDLVFFYSPIHHVAIYIGHGKILHTYGKPGVTISKLNTGWWNKHYTTARRVL